GLLVAVDDPAAGQVVRAQLDHHPVLREDPDVVLTHLARDVSENLVPVAQLDAEHRVRQSLDHGALDLDDTVLLRHVLRYLSSTGPTRVMPGPTRGKGGTDMVDGEAADEPHARTHRRRT